MYKVQPFIWHKIGDHRTFFQTQYSSVIITNDKLIDFLIGIEQNNILELDKESIESYFLDESDSVISFLMENSLFREKIIRSFSVERLVILSNDNNFFDSVRINLKDLYIIEEIREKDIELFLFKNNDLLIIFLNPFNLENMNRIDSFAKKIIFWLNLFFHIITRYILQIFTRNHGIIHALCVFFICWKAS